MIDIKFSDSRGCKSMISKVFHGLHPWAFLGALQCRHTIKLFGLAAAQPQVGQLCGLETQSSNTNPWQSKTVQGNPASIAKKSKLV